MNPNMNAQQAAEFEMILQKMKSIAVTAEKRTGQAAPKSDPEQIRLLHRQAYAQATSEKDSEAKFCHRQTYCAEMFTSKQPLARLKRITIKAMRMELMHKDKYLLVRVLERCFKMSGIMTVVDDPEGSVSIMSLYNYLVSDRVNLDEILPVGTILAIKEPYYKYSNTNSCVIRCDSPSDIVILQRYGANTGVDEEALRAGEALLQGIVWKNPLVISQEALSNTVRLTKDAVKPLDYFKRKHYWDAIESCSRALTSQGNGEPEECSLFVRANAYYQVGLYERCLGDLFVILKKRPTDYGAIYLGGQAFYALRRFEEAHVLFEALLRLYPGDAGIDLFQKEMWHKSAGKRIGEARDGRYDLNAMMAEARMTKSPRLDCADYSAPVKLVKDGDGDLRVVVKAGVEPGTLLMAVKAFEIVYAGELKDAASGFSLINFKTNICSDPPRSQLATKIALKLLANPSTALHLYQLKTAEGKPAASPSVYADDLSQREPVADMSQLHRIVALNAFSPESLDDTNLGLRRAEADADTGLWLLPSHIRHACESSAVYTFVGDMLLVRAKYRLNAGDEVTIPCIEAVASLEERAEELGNRGILCRCWLCEVERAEPKAQLSRRNALVAEFRTRFKLGQPGDLEMVTRLVEQIRETYRRSPQRAAGGLQQALYLPYTALGAVYLQRDDRIRAAQMFEAALRALGFTDAHEEYLLKGGAPGTSFPQPILLTLAPMTAIHIYHYYWNADEYDQAERWFRIARGLDRILHGGDEAVFKRRYHSFIVV
jgi:tetratricopeptide (TPR) repeat protein